VKRPKDFETVLGGKPWKVCFVRRGHPKVPKAYGYCYWNDQEIYVRYDVCEKSFLDTLIHEMQHALSLMHLSAEAWVTQTSSEITVGLIKAGFRVDENSNEVR
jgi:hypothetical protein